MSKTNVLFVIIVVASQVLETYGTGGGVCLATPFFFGPQCRSSTSVIGRKGLKIRYSVRVNGSGATLVCCEGYSPADSSFHSIGCNHSSLSGKLEWGNNLATPKIKCKGIPFGASVSWSH